MVKVHIEDIAYMSFGILLTIKNCGRFRIGDIVQDDAGNTYRIKGFHHYLSPTHEKLVDLLVKQVS